jgi:outer membrane protein assembly factor BamB
MDDGSGREQVGTSENAVIALDAASGHERWRVPLYGTGMPTPAIIGNTIVEHDGNGYVTGIDVRNGHLLYRRFIGGAASMVSIMPVGRHHFITAGHIPNAVLKIDARTGNIKWQTNFAQAVSGLSDCPPAGDKVQAYCDYTVPPQGVDKLHVGAQADERAFALNLHTGNIAWDVPIASGALPQWNEAAIPVVYGGALYIGSSVAPQMHAIDPASGRILWTRQVKGVVKGGVSGTDHAVYFGDYAGYLWALSAKDGSVIGVKNMNTVFNVASPLIAGQTLFIGTMTGEIIALPLEEIRRSHDA